MGPISGLPMILQGAPYGTKNKREHAIYIYIYIYIYILKCDESFVPFRGQYPWAINPRGQLVYTV